MTEEEDYFEDAVLFAAAKKNHISLFKEYYDQRCKKNEFNPDLKDALGNTALHYSSTFNHYDISKMLLDLKADPNKQNNNGETPLHIAAWKNHLEIVKLLIEYKGDVSIANNNKQKVVNMAKTVDMKQLIESARLAQQFDQSDYAVDDEDDDEEGGQQKPYKPTPHDNSDMIADSDDE
eukprot:gene1011-1281_t